MTWKPFRATPAEQEAHVNASGRDASLWARHARIRSLYGRRDVLAFDLSRLITTQTPTAGCNAHSSVLDVSLLHDLLLEKVLEIYVREDTIAFTQDDAAAVDLVARQEYQVAFLLNPTRMEQIVEPAMAGKRMPRKSTYFYPKLLTGIVMHKEVGDADYSG